MKYKKMLLIMLLIICTINLFGCNSKKNREDLLDASKPITVTVWHYYNGQIKDRFDNLVEKFNETVGIEQGIVIDAKSLGDVNQLADAVYDAANNTIGSQPMPDIFMAYPENAYRVNKVSELVDLETIFSQEELKRYKEDFLEEGRFGVDEKLRILPIAKSTENLFLNKTFWDDFSKKSGADIEKLRTWEGLVEVAKQYKETTGKAFLGIDANANYMLVSSMQLGTEIYNYQEDDASFNLTRNVAKNIWENYYVPYINGYFKKTGRFSSDDAKIGNTLAYTGSTAGTAYFPTEVNVDKNNVYKIESMTLPYPVFENGKPYAIQQGAGMCVAKSDESHVYASGVFLKWFTEPDQNLEFAISTGYFPVMDESLNKESLVEQVKESKVVGESIPKMIETTDYMFNNFILYSNKPFKSSYELRILLEEHLYNKVTSDLEILDNRIQEGESREVIIESLVSESEFEKWYIDIVNQATSVLKK